jgi:hypothetical protein
MKGPLRSLWGALQMAQGGPLVAQVLGQLWRLGPLVRWLQEEDTDVAVVTRAEDLLARPKGSLTVAVLGAEELRWLNVVRPRIQTQRARVVLFQPTDSEEHKFSLRELAPDLDSWVGTWAELPEEPPDWTIEALQSAPGRFMWRGETTALHAALAIARPDRPVVTVPIAEALTQGLRAMVGADPPIVLFDGLHDDVHIRRHLRGVRWALAASGRAGGAVLLGDAPTPPGFVSVTSTPVPWLEALRRLGGGPDASLTAALTGLNPARLPDDSAWQAAPPTGWLAWSFAALERAPETWGGPAEPDDDLAQPEALTTATLRWPEQTPELALRAAETLAVEGLEGAESARVLGLVQRAAALRASAQDPHGLGATLLRLEDTISAQDAPAVSAILEGLSLEGAPDGLRLILAERALGAADAGLVTLAQAVALARPLLSALGDERLTAKLSSGEASLADALLRRLSAHDVTREPKDLLVLTAAALSLTRRGARLTGRLTALIQLLDEQATQLSEADQLTQAIPLRRERLRLLLAQGPQSSQLVSEAHAALAALLARAGDLAGALAEYEEARRGWSAGWPTAVEQVVLLKELARLARLVGNEGRRVALLEAIWAVVEAEREPPSLAQRVVDELGELIERRMERADEYEHTPTRIYRWSSIRRAIIPALAAEGRAEELAEALRGYRGDAWSRGGSYAFIRAFVETHHALTTAGRLELANSILHDYFEIVESEPDYLAEFFAIIDGESDIGVAMAYLKAMKAGLEHVGPADFHGLGIQALVDQRIAALEGKMRPVIFPVAEDMVRVPSTIYAGELAGLVAVITFFVCFMWDGVMKSQSIEIPSATSEIYSLQDGLRAAEVGLERLEVDLELMDRWNGGAQVNVAVFIQQLNDYQSIVVAERDVVMMHPSNFTPSQLNESLAKTRALQVGIVLLAVQVADLRQRLLAPDVETFWTATAQEACLDVPPTDRAACFVQVALNLGDSDELGPFNAPRERLERCLLIGAVDPQRPELRVLAPGEPPPPAWLVVYDPDPLTPRVAVRLCDPALDDSPTP